MQQSLFKYYLDNQDSLVNLYNGKFIVIKDNTVVGVFQTEDEAFFDSIAKYVPGTYIIQKCSAGNKDYTQMFHSRVVFA